MIIIVKYGPTPAGQWLNVFYQQYSQLDDGQGPVGVFDDSWWHWGYFHFPFISNRGKLKFFWFEDGVEELADWFGSDARWLVFADK